MRLGHCFATKRLTICGAMKVDAQNYSELRAWFARIVPETVPTELITAESNPVACLDQIAARSAANARSGLAMAINDTIEMTADLPAERVAAIDRLLESDGLPSLTEMRLRFSKVIRRVVARGAIRNEVEYYAVRNAVEIRGQDQGLWKLLAAYEERAENQSRQ